MTGSYRSLKCICKNYVPEGKSTVQHDKHLRTINNEREEKMHQQMEKLKLKNTLKLNITI